MNNIKQNQIKRFTAEVPHEWNVTETMVRTNMTISEIQYQGVSERTHRLVELISQELGLFSSVYIDMNKNRGIVCFEVEKYAVDVSIVIIPGQITIEIPSFNIERVYNVTSIYETEEMFYQNAMDYAKFMKLPEQEVGMRLLEAISESMNLDISVFRIPDTNKISVVRQLSNGLNISGVTECNADSVKEILSKLQKYN